MRQKLTIEMIAGVFQEPDMIELAGSAKELDLLSRELLIDNAKVILEYQNSASIRYSKNLESIQVRHFPSKPVKISIEDNSLLITGSPEKLRILSESIKMEEEGLKNYHIHIEYFDGHFYLSKDSKPLVISFQ